jgi:hypothetical protein
MMYERFEADLIFLADSPDFLKSFGLRPGGERQGVDGKVFGIGEDTVSTPEPAVQLLQTQE